MAVDKSGVAATRQKYLIYVFIRQEFIPFFGGKSNRLGEAFQLLCQLIGHREPVPTLTGILS